MNPEDAQPQALRRRLVQRLLLEAKSERSTAGRVDLLSRLLLGYRYQANPLIGSADSSEVLTASLDGFDCVTYIETVLALARARSAEDFMRWLRRIRYEAGSVKWERRNHYMTHWIRNNIREGIISPISFPDVSTISRERVLDVVPGLAARRARIRCVAKRAAPRLYPGLESGDLIFFVSTRSNLDMFHCGIIVRDGKRMLMRHASRSQGAVVEQDLNGFLKANRMAGVVVARPREV
jgi:hypothetical protein